MEPALLIPIIAISGGLAIPIVAIWTTHKRKVLEMQIQLRGGVDDNVRAELNALREEVRSLRDTSMQYDISFDTALQRMERRMLSVEGRANTSAQEDPQNITIGK